MTETGMLTSNPLRGRAPRRHRGPAAAGHERAGRRRRGRRLRRRRDRPCPGEGRQRAAGLLAHAREEQGGVHRRRLLPDRRRGLLLGGRLPRDRRALEGPHHHRRLQRLPEGGRARDRRAARAWRSPPWSACRIPTSARRSRPSSCRGRKLRAPTEAEVIAWLRSRLANFKVPKRVYVVERAAEEHHGQGAEERASRPLRHAGGVTVPGTRAFIDRLVGTLRRGHAQPRRAPCRSPREAAAHAHLRARASRPGALMARRAVALYNGLDEEGRATSSSSSSRATSRRTRRGAGSGARPTGDDPSPATLARLQRVTEPPRQEVFRRMNMAPGGTAVLVGLRKVLLDRLARPPARSPPWTTTSRTSSARGSTAASSNCAASTGARPPRCWRS